MSFKKFSDVLNAGLIDITHDFVKIIICRDFLWLSHGFAWQITLDSLK
jgi:hypothetical protein